MHKQHETKKITKVRLQILKINLLYDELVKAKEVWNY